jgi:antitoxin component of MazEF toxin-antitoxin module
MTLTVRLTYANVCQMREIVKVRMVAGSVVISLPQSVLDPVGLKAGDRVVIEAEPPRLIITKEGRTMTSSERLELEIDLLHKKKAALQSDLYYKEGQYNNAMPCEEGMADEAVAALIMSEIVRDRDRLDVEIAEKKIQLHDIRGGGVKMVDDEMRFPYPFNGQPNSTVVVPCSAMVQGEDWIKSRIEGWFRDHGKPKTGETKRIPDYQFDPHLSQPTG